MSRSLSKGPYISEGVMRAIRRFDKTKQMIKIWSRSSVIMAPCIGKTVHVYNGRKFIPVSISEVHVGHKFGEFAPTRTQAKHAGKNKKK